MIITTSGNIEGKEIVEYKDIVFGEVVTGVNFLKDFGASFRNIFGGRSKGYEKEFITARREAIEEMKNRAKDIGANAIIGIKMDYEVLGPENGMFLVICSGTAVVIK